jgi:hypothetical protein
LTTSPPVSGGLFFRGNVYSWKMLVLFNKPAAQGSKNFAWCDGTNEIYKYDF